MALPGIRGLGVAPPPQSAEPLITHIENVATMGRSFQEWLNQQDGALVSKVRSGDESNKPLLNQINWIWVQNLMNKRADLNPSSAELLDWVTSGQIDAMRR